MPGSTTPKVWVPSKSKPLSVANVSAGEWVQVQISYRTTNITPVVSTPDRFLIHVLFEPNTDDSVSHPDQPTAFGGSPTAGIRTRNVYRVDPGITFQVPWSGQLSLVAGGESDPATCIVDVILRRGFPPRMPPKNAIDIFDFPDFDMLICSNPLAAYQLFMGSMAKLCDVDGTIRPMGERIWWPPVIRSPKLVPATWIQIPGPGVAPPAPFIPFPDGAEFIEIVNASALAGSPTQIRASTLGNTIDIDVASGVRRTIAHVTQGSGIDGTPALWAPFVALNSATIWSTLGD